MSVVTTPLGPVALLVLVFLSFLFGNFSRRLGAVTKMNNYERWFFLAGSFIAVAATSQIMRAIAFLAPQEAPPMLLKPWFALLTQHTPFAIGVTLDLVLVYYYWGWILRENVE